MVLKAMVNYTPTLPALCCVDQHLHCEWFFSAVHLSFNIVNFCRDFSHYSWHCDEPVPIVPLQAPAKCEISFRGLWSSFGFVLDPNHMD